MCLVLGTERLGEPLGTAICAYHGGTAWGLLLQMQKLIDELPMKKRPKGIPPRKKPTGIDLKVLEKEQNPPPGTVLLREVDPVPGVTKFSPKPVIENGIVVFNIPLSRAVIKANNLRVLAGMIYAMVWRGNSWRDRSGKVHDNPY
ncbi:MAG TPA: hypothetical protein VMV71_02500 [Candidatus Paceibacterota bacterium]|nr:hypothetical protein [Candidatus Paceibacterota bacterium]